MSCLGIVIIGRNEGQRLRRCLESVGTVSSRVVYVDSGSTDDSVEMARSMGADVVELDMSQPFSAARARNAGLARLLELEPESQFVQFIDGDCEMNARWWGVALDTLRTRTDVAAVAGRLSERHPEASIYNRLCDLEWSVPPGEVKHCGGIAMYRVSCLRDVGGFNPAVIAGEEPELCLRLRRKGWKILRLADDMAWHDAAMTRFGQWWKRAVRGGHAYAQGAALHARTPERFNVRQLVSAAFWGLGLPLLAITLSVAGIRERWLLLGLAAIGLLYILLVSRVAMRRMRGGESLRLSLLYAIFVVLGKFACCVGACMYLRNHLLGRGAKLIEYKTASCDIPSTSGPASSPSETR